jgi:hypothetical protein
MKAILSTVIIVEKLLTETFIERDGHERETIKKTKMAQAN